MPALESQRLLLKQTMLGSRLGLWAIAVRDRVQLVRSALNENEFLGMLANDKLASLLIARFCRDGRTVIDVGAHIGSIVAEILHHCPRAKVVAIEAMPDKAARLRRRFPRIECHAVALGEVEGEATFFVNRSRSGYSSLGRPAVAERGDDVIEIRVPVRRLDDLHSHHGVDAIKIDVEGAELGVLRGADRLIGHSRPTIMIESGPPLDDGLGYTKEAMWSWFDERGYALLIPNRVAHEDPGLSKDAFLESHLYPRRTSNYIATPREERSTTMLRAREILGTRFC